MVKLLGNGLLFLALIIILSTSTACSALFDDRKEITRNQVLQDYTFDSATILASLDRGDTNVFMLQEATPQATSSPSPGLVSWSQSDYFRVAQALNQKLWQVNLGAQTLFNMYFGMDCSNVEQGVFSSAVFDSFQIIQTKDEKVRIEYGVGIFPSKNEVHTNRIEYYPSLGEYTPIDLAQYRISALDALQIAEKNGGKEKRSANKNACVIRLMAPGSDGKGWNIAYQYQDTDNRLYEIKINPQTGAFMILYP